MDNPNRAVLWKRTGKLLLTLGMLAVFLFALPPFRHGIKGIGSFVPMLYSAATLLFLWYKPLRERLKSRKATRLLWRIALTCYFAGTAVVLGLLGLILSAQWDAPGPENRTLVVLGCQVRGEDPSLMLSKRLEAACNYLTAHPDAPCVVSGGQGPGEEISEAEAMRRYLEDRGVEPSRIYMEDRSENTAENLRFSAAVIREQGLPADIAVATDGFHQWRGKWYAGKNGLSAKAVAARTPWYLQECYYTREVLAVAKTLVLG
ncbi:MAG: YdcF family protein [Clostridiales bacterium]|nr:YdcF family protein [Clostridiales bacterium]